MISLKLPITTKQVGKHFRHIHKMARFHQKQATQTFHATHRHAKRILRKHKVVLHKVRQHSLRTAAVATLSAGMLAVPSLSTATTPSAEAHAASHELQNALVADHVQSTGQFSVAPQLPYGPGTEDASIAGLLPQKIEEIVPSGVHTFTPDQATQLTDLFQKAFNITAKTELDGIQLNANQGIIAGEQHLPLYPGQPLSEHHKDIFTGAISDPTAPLTGIVSHPSYGYWTDGKASVTKKMVEQEKWYFVAQSFLSPQFRDNPDKVYNFFKYRKFLVINRKTGQTVVVDFADAGPSPFTHRQYGGSNEVLIGLGLGSVRTGEIIAMFIDDPNDTIPLGPLTGYNP
jgi:hypothetical protein